jgi:hypothetical protein
MPLVTAGLGGRRAWVAQGSRPRGLDKALVQAMDVGYQGAVCLVVEPLASCNLAGARKFRTAGQGRATVVMTHE